MTERRTAKPVPAWAQRRALGLTADDVELIESVRDDLRAFLSTAMNLADRVGAVFALRHRNTMDFDDSCDIFNELFGIDDVEQLVELGEVLMDGGSASVGPPNRVTLADGVRAAPRHIGAPSRRSR